MAVGFALVPVERLKPLFERSVNAEGIDELAQSISTTGILEPLVVRKSDFAIIAGYRRYLAAKKAGLNEVPCTLIDCDDSETLRLCLIENIQRENLSDYELAKRLKEFKDKTGLTDEQIAKLLGKSRAWVTNHLRFLELEKLANVSRETLEKLTEYHARAILAQNRRIQGALLREIERAVTKESKIPSTSEIERMAEELNRNEELKKEVEQEQEEETRQKLRDWLLTYAMALKDISEPKVNTHHLFLHMRGLLDKFEIYCPVCGRRVRLACECENNGGG